MTFPKSVPSYAIMMTTKVHNLSRMHTMRRDFHSFMNRNRFANNNFGTLNIVKCHRIKQKCMSSYVPSKVLLRKTSVIASKCMNMNMNMAVRQLSTESMLNDLGQSVESSIIESPLQQLPVQSSSISSVLDNIPDWQIVEAARKMLLQIHDVSGLPWWATIALSAILVRTTVTFPFSVLQQSNTAKLRNLEPEMNEIVKRLKMEANLACSRGEPENKVRWRYNALVLVCFTYTLFLRKVIVRLIVWMEMNKITVSSLHWHPSFSYSEIFLSRRNPFFLMKILNLFSALMASFVFDCLVKQEYKELMVKNNCHWAKSIVVLIIQMPVWLSFSVATRNLCFMRPHHDIAAQNTFLELMSGGFGWIHNLAIPDPYFILPVVFGLSNLIVMETHELLRVQPPKNWERRLSIFLRCFSVLGIFIASLLPAGVVVYWATSSMYGLVQIFLLASPRFRRLLRIPITKAELAHPYRHMYTTLRSKLKLGN